MRRITSSILVAVLMVIVTNRDAWGGEVRRFIDNRDGTVTDLHTGLQWEKKLDGEACSNAARRPVARVPLHR
jgi:hypothetical protein